MLSRFPSGYSNCFVNPIVTIVYSDNMLIMFIKLMR